MWDLPGPGITPVSAALAGGFLSTANGYSSHHGSPSVQILEDHYLLSTWSFLLQVVRAQGLQSHRALSVIKLIQYESYYSVFYPFFNIVLCFIFYKNH